MKLLQLLSIDRIKLFHSRLWWISLLIVGLVSLTINILVFAFSDDPFMLDMPASFIGSPGLLSSSFFILIFAFLYVNKLVNHDYRDRTLATTLSSGFSRMYVVLSKLIMVVFAIILLYLFVNLLNFLTMSIFSLIRDDITFSLDGIEWGKFVQWHLANIIGLFPYLGLAFLLAILSKSAVVTIVFPMLFLLVFESIIMVAGTVIESMGYKIVTQIYNFLPASLTQIITPELSLGGIFDDLAMAGGEDPFSMPVAYLLIFLYFGICLLLSIFFFQRKDLGG